MLDEVIQLDKKYYLNTFGDRLPVCFEKGEGMKLFDDKGNTYYDFLGGIAVNALGHGHKDFINALKNQLDKVVHTSSLYYIENQAKLAQKLVENTCAEKHISQTAVQRPMRVHSNLQRFIIIKKVWISMR